MLNNLFGRREQEETVRKMGRLPPGQALTQKFPVLHYGPVPSFNPTTWDFRVFGLVEEEKRWSWEEFNRLPRRKIKMDIHCVTRWSKFDTEWEGLHLQDLIDQGFIRPKPEARFIMQHCEYGFTVNIPIEVALGEQFLMATHFNGQPLEPEHGYPLRGVAGALPETPMDENDRYLWKGGKWLRGLEFMAGDRPGFWEQAGYSMSANIWREERFGW
ncbi:MAG TPA: molybdopterin-dependent oxidoreductase [Anaerolineae bacterium]|nr:molybdopterin-dependent oxidoreductase [Anaerolineae bacterium]